jgi:3-oxoacyl-[acyl-carrier-protein] synthase-3
VAARNEPVAMVSDTSTASHRPVTQKLVRDLSRVWVEFETALSKVPIIEKLEQGRLRIEDYRMLLLNLRQQVIEGSRWIARAASYIGPEHAALRSSFVQHAGDEQLDYRMLEEDFVACGGAREEIVSAEKNIGSEALSAWMFHKASRENPFDLLGAMFIIEGLGNRLATRWGEAIKDQLGMRDDQVRFLLYHGENDETHLERLWAAIDGLDPSPELARAIVKTAKVTARLYRLQLEELGNI